MNRLNRILIATDFSEVSDNALDHAALIALKNDAELHVFHARVPFPNSSLEAMSREFPDPERLQRSVERFAEHEMDKLALRFNVPVKKCVVNAFDPSAAIAEHAVAHDVDLVALGTHGRGPVAHLLLGSVAERTMRRSPVSVLAVGAGPAHELRESSYRRILVPVDFSPASSSALAHAAEIAQQHHAELNVLHVVEQVPHPGFYFSNQDTILGASEQFRQRLEAALEDLIATHAHEVKATGTVDEGRAYRRICEVAAAQKADLIVMGSHGLGALERLLVGSVTERTLRSAPCPVLVDKSDEALNV